MRNNIHPFWRIGLGDTEDISEHLPLLEPLILLPKPKKRKQNEAEQKRFEKPRQEKKKAPPKIRMYCMRYSWAAAYTKVMCRIKEILIT